MADRFLHAPLGEVERHSIGEIKGVMVDKIEGIEPPLAHMIPEGSGHIVLPIVSMIALATIDWRIFLASLLTFPLSILCMGITFKISGKNFDKYNANIDPENEHLIQNAISELAKGKTLITIAHRIATIEHADQILVVDVRW